jgi:hypothetical protein
MLRPVAIMDRQKHIQTTEKKVCTDKKKKETPYSVKSDKLYFPLFFGYKKKEEKNLLIRGKFSSPR